MVGPSPPVTRSPESAPARAGERYTEQQLVEILRRAAERKEGLVTDADGRFSLEEITQIASEVGIEPAHVATAAAELTAGPPPRSGALGAPTVFRFERWVDGEVSRSTIGELIDIARRRTGLQGTVSEALATIEWAGGGTWLATRAIWRRLARKYPRDAATLGAVLVEAAQRAEDDARKESE